MRPASAARGARSVREHLAPALYFLQVHLLYATLGKLCAGEREHEAGRFQGA
jgi:hypothetical protein